MPNSVSNTSVSKPVLNTNQNLDVFMNGFGWSSDTGIFVVTDENDVLLDPPQSSFLIRE